MSEKITFTPEQAAAIETRDGPLLVSAAAGSGKTKVLVNRLLNFITDENEPCDISDFLIITYTRAAAAELRSKIRDEINARLSNQPQNRRLRRQATLIYTAHIGTIHSFCAELLRENAHLAQIPPDFRVADENECRLLKSKVLEEILEARYETIGIHQVLRCWLIRCLPVGMTGGFLRSFWMPTQSLKVTPNPRNG